MTKKYNGKLLRAAKEGDSVRIHAALNAGADINTTDMSGWTPLFYAAILGNQHAVSVLIAAGAKIELEDKVGITAAELAGETCRSMVE
jgi:ankyrin repeat protein